MASTSMGSLRQLNGMLHVSLTKTIAKSGPSGFFRMSSNRTFVSDSNESNPSKGASPPADDSTPSTSGQVWRTPLERDPTLPPKPPQGTFPHPFPERRDDPHSNSMRTVYQQPLSGVRSSLSGYKSPLRPGTTLNKLNAMSGIGGVNRGVNALDIHRIYTPLYVIHVKSTGNNTIVSFHAPSTPKLSNRSGKGKQTTTVRPSHQPEPAFSVGSNPDEPLKQEGISTEDAGLNGDETPAATTPNTAPVPIPDPIPQAPEYIPNIATNRCIGWASGGSCHYKKVNRSTYEAGYEASVRILHRIEEAFTHLASGGIVEDLPPMKDIKPSKSDTSYKPGRLHPLLFNVKRLMWQSFQLYQPRMLVE